MVSLTLGVILWGVVRTTRLGLGVLYSWDSDIFAIVTLGVLEIKVRILFCLFYTWRLRVLDYCVPFPHTPQWALVSSSWLLKSLVFPQHLAGICRVALLAPTLG